MASLAGTIGAYMLDGLQVFLRPVTVIARAADRHLSPIAIILVLVALTLATDAVRLLSEIIPPAFNSQLSFLDVLLDALDFIAIFAIGTLILFGTLVVFGSKASIFRFFAAALSLAATVFGAFVFAFVIKAVVALLFLGSDGGGLEMLGRALGPAVLGLLLVSYSVIVARFGGEVSWLIAVIATVVCFAMLVAASFILDTLYGFNTLNPFLGLMQQNGAGVVYGL